MRRTRVIAWAAVVAAAASWLAVAEEKSALESALGSITAEESLGHIQHLASDEMKGRLAGSPEGRQAAKYVAEAFRQAGLKPAGPDGAFLQPFTRSRAATAAASRLTVTVAGKTFDLQGQKGFVAFPFSAAGHAAAEIVFVGYGITAPEEHYDDYAGLDVTGKIVLVMRHEPARGVEGQAFAGKRDTEHSYFNTKALNAEKHGAAAMLFFSDPVNHGDEPDYLFADRAPGDKGVQIPVVQVHRATAVALLAAAGKDLPAIQKEIDRTITPNSFVLAGSKADLTLTITAQVRRMQNVVAILPGTDEVATPLLSWWYRPDRWDPRGGIGYASHRRGPQESVADEYVVVGAHYDHIGTGEYGARSGRGQVFNGADDNASGTAALLEIAQALGTHHLGLRRSVLFIAFDGEEAGLLGSRHYVEHPLVPLAKTVAMLNLDMIGRARKDEIAVLGVGSAEGLAEMVKRLAATPGVGLTARTSESAGGGSSDDASFYNRRIPVLFFFGSMHADYHTPNDDWEKINTDGVVRIARLAMLVTRELADRDERLAFVPPKPASQRPFLGVASDPTAPEGLVLGQVVPGSAADRAGLRPGDLLLAINGQDLRAWGDLTAAVGAKKPGDTVTLTVRRGDATRDVPVTLGSRADAQPTR